MSSRPRTRFTASVMLLVWLLTLGAGIANACLLHEDHAQAGRTGIAAVSGAREAGARVDRHGSGQALAAAGIATADGDQMVQIVACRALCVAGQTAMPRQKAAFCADPQTDAVLVATCGPVNLLADPVPRLVRRADASPPELPVSIRFLRLTL